MRFSLSKKLFVLICLILVFTIIPLLYISETALSRLGSYAYHENKTQIYNTSYHYLSFIIEEMAQKYDEIFKKTKAASSSLAEHITKGYDHIDTEPNRLSEGSDLTWNHENQMFISPKEQDVFVAYWGDDTISDKVRTELNLLSHFMPVLKKTKNQVKECLATHIITISGIGYYFTSNPDAKQACYNLPPPLEFDLRDGEPVTIFTETKSKTYETEWTDTYKDDIIDGLMITATSPIYDKEGRLRGITGIDIPVDQIIDSLIKKTLFPIHEDQGSPFAFIQDGKGNLIAFPRKHFTLFGFEIDFDKFENSDDIFDYKLKDSSIDSIREVASKLHTHTQKVLELILHNEKYLLFTSHLPSVHWQIVLVVKETDILSSVQKTSLALKKEKKIIWKNFSKHSFMVFLIAIISIIFAIKSFISPIEKFIETTHKIAKGEFSHTIKINRSDEIGILSKSINSMVDDLAISNKKVLEKTSQLIRLNENLSNAGELERKAIASDLHDSAAQTLGFTISKLKNLKDSDTPIREEDIALIEEHIEQVIDEIRLIIYQLRPPILDDFEIDIALESLIDGYNEKNACQIDFINETDHRLHTSQTARLALYRITNELIVNILKHAKEKKAKIILTNSDTSISVSVEDKGVGFDLDQIEQPGRNTFGLYNISERIKGLDGKFKIMSNPGEGTKVTISIPLKSNQD